jgi:acyl-homoserine-lactone acylase
MAFATRPNEEVNVHGHRMLRPRGFPRPLMLILAALLVIGLLGVSPFPGFNLPASYEALVRRTEGGVPHIKANDFGSLGFGTGYAMAQDNVCILADQFLRFSAQRSKFLGSQGGNLQSDFFYQLFIDRGEAVEPVDPRQTALFRGAAAGYNRWLRDTGVANLSDPTCQGQPWVREIADVDWRRISRMNFFYPALLSQIVAAAPPPPVAVGAPAARGFSAEDGLRVQAAYLALLEPLKDLGSNGIAIGREGTVNETGMLLANPHQPWTGTSRFYAFHQTLPGELDVVGANVMGRPQVGLGVTEHIAWTSTVQTGPLNSFYLLSLVPGNPTQYFFDGVPHDMIAETVTVEVPDGSGGFQSVAHTFYSTHFGAVLVGGANFPWTNTTAIAVRAADAGWRGIDALMPQYQAESVFDYKVVQDTYQFNPSNQIAADSSGNAYYANTAQIPNLDDAQRAACTLPGNLLNGSLSLCMWKTDPDAAAPGIFGPARLPFHIRSDFASNMNDSYWLSNPFAPITGFDSSLGTVGTARSFRTRSGLVQVIERIEGADDKGTPKFTLEQLQELITDNVAYTGRILRDDLVTLCEGNPVVTLTDGTQVNIAPACPVLAAWDLRDALDSRGAHLFREFAGVNAPRNYAVPFDVNDPVNTPRGLDTVNNPGVLQALATAVRRLQGAGIPLDARLGDVQSVSRNGVRIPIPGGSNGSGVLNIIGAPFSAAGGGYPNVTSGASWIQATEFTEGGPVSRGILAYSQTTNPNSPHFADMTELFSRGEWVDLPFREADVAAAAIESVQVTEGQNDCKNGGWQAFTNPSFKNQGDCVKHMKELRRIRVVEILNRAIRLILGH